MAERLVITDSLLTQVAGRLQRHTIERLVLHAGLSRRGDQRDWLTGRGLPTGSQLSLEVRGVMGAEAFQPAGPSPPDGAPAGVMLLLGLGPAAGLIAGSVIEKGKVAPLDRVRLIGAGIHDLALPGRALGPTSPIRKHGFDTEELWSRSIGALGRETWLRLRQLQIAVVGCGRSGAMLAQSLARTGIGRLVLIDPDRVELHNLGEMDLVTTRDIGQFKAVALEQRLRQLDHVGHVDSLPVSAMDVRALLAIKTCDVICCCVDNPSARLAVAFLGTALLKPLLDVGTGVQAEPRNGAPRGRRMGADLRLVLPDRCLLCSGGILHFDRAVTDGQQSTGESPDAWRHQRAGSLRSLNGVAVHLALRLLEDFVGGRIRQSTWLHLEFGEDGTPALTHPAPAAERDCVLCRFTASGDDGIKDYPGFVSVLKQEIAAETAQRPVSGQAEFR